MELSFIGNYSILYNRIWRRKAQKWKKQGENISKSYRSILARESTSLVVKLMAIFQFKRKEKCEQLTQGSIIEVIEMDRARKETIIPGREIIWRWESSIYLDRSCVTLDLGVGEEGNQTRFWPLKAKRKKNISQIEVEEPTLGVKIQLVYGPAMLESLPLVYRAICPMGDTTAQYTQDLHLMASSIRGQLSIFFSF